MKISEIENKKVKIGAHSITVKDDDGKTCGVVRNATRFNELRLADQTMFWRSMVKCGIADRAEFVNRFIVCDGKPYFLHDMRTLDAYEQLFSRFPDREWELEKKRCNECKQVAENAAKIATVIPCYVLI